MCVKNLCCWILQYAWCINNILYMYASLTCIDASVQREEWGLVIVCICFGCGLGILVFGIDQYNC